MTRRNLTVAELKAVLHYDPVSGVFTWLARPVQQKQDQSFNTLLAGKRAGTLCPKGYRQIVIRRKMFRAHQLAWLYITGEWPASGVDHWNEDKDDNRWTNLRLANASQNGANVGPRCRNKSGLKGVSFCSFTGRWRVSITVRGVYHFLGRYDDSAAAHAAYVSAARRHFGTFARFS